MIKAFATAALLLVLAPSAALAQRAGDAALGAVAGAVVLGPVGAVAGAFVGYTAGPSISRSWGLEGRGRRGTEAGVERQHARRQGGSRGAGDAVHESAVATSRREGIPRRTRRVPPALPTGPDPRLSAGAARSGASRPLAAAPTASRGGRTTVTVQAASAATLAETLPSSVRSIEFCRAPITM